MIKIENVEVVGLEHALRGMRNPKNSWEKSDSGVCDGICETCGMANSDRYCMINAYNIGQNDHDLASKLAKGGPVHAKYRRMLVVYLDITAPLYWWKEFDTYKVGTVANSCSTMHKIHEKEFTLEDFSCEHLYLKGISNDDTPEIYFGTDDYGTIPEELFDGVVEMLNKLRIKFLETKDKRYWYAMIQLLPSSYNQRRTIMLNYEVLVGMYRDRKNHKLDEWRELCKWIESLPYSELITLDKLTGEGGNKVWETKTEEKESLTCKGCKYDESTDIVVHLNYCTHCKRQYLTEEERDIHKDLYDGEF